jgi:hypothetical protein
MYQGQTVFAQLVELLPRRAFENAVQRYEGQRHVRSFSCRDQLLCMIFAQVTGRASLRETVSCLRAIGSRRYHCGIRSVVSRSTLADANEHRDYRIFMDTALAMINATRLELPVDTDLRRLNARVYAIDSTTIDLCLKLFPWACFCGFLTQKRTICGCSTKSCHSRERTMSWIAVMSISLVCIGSTWPPPSS